MTLEEILANDRFLRRQVFWSSAAAIGDPDWLDHTAGQIGMERFDTIEGAAEDGFGVKTFFLGAKNVTVKLVVLGRGFGESIGRQVLRNSDLLPLEVELLVQFGDPIGGADGERLAPVRLASMILVLQGGDFGV